MRAGYAQFLHYLLGTDLKKQPWSKELTEFKSGDVCEDCSGFFDEIWLGDDMKKAYLFCVPCRDAWLDTKGFKEKHKRRKRCGNK